MLVKKVTYECSYTYPGTPSFPLSGSMSSPSAVFVILRGCLDFVTTKFSNVVNFKVSDVNVILLKPKKKFLRVFLCCGLYAYSEKLINIYGARTLFSCVSLWCSLTRLQYTDALYALHRHCPVITAFQCPTSPLNELADQFFGHQLKWTTQKRNMHRLYADWRRKGFRTRARIILLAQQQQGLYAYTMAEVYQGLGGLTPPPYTTDNCMHQDTFVHGCCATHRALARAYPGVQLPPPEICVHWWTSPCSYLPVDDSQ
jgi:hypothetical protein